MPGPLLPNIKSFVSLSGSNACIYNIFPSPASIVCSSLSSSHQKETPSSDPFSTQPIHAAVISMLTSLSVSLTPRPPLHLLLTLQPSSHFFLSPFLFYFLDPFPLFLKMPSQCLALLFKVLYISLVKSQSGLQLFIHIPTLSLSPSLTFSLWQKDARVLGLPRCLSTTGLQLARRLVGFQAPRGGLSLAPHPPTSTTLHPHKVMLMGSLASLSPASDGPLTATLHFYSTQFIGNQMVAFSLGCSVYSSLIVLHRAH